MKRIVIIAAAVLAALLVAGAGVGAAADKGAFLPGWTAWEEAGLRADLDGDGGPDDVRLADRAVAVEAADGTRARTPADWLVSGADAADLDGDGACELVMLVWKRGSFGTSHPFWVRPDRGFGQHVYVMRYGRGAFEPVWMSSAVGAQVARMELDGAGRLHLVDADGAETLWEWGEWGFERAEDEDAGDHAAPDAAAVTAPLPTVRSAADEDATVTLIAVGDNLAHADVVEGAWSRAQQAFDFAPLYEHVAARVAGFDVAVVNQETPLVADPALRGGWPEFGTPDAMAAALAGAGFDVALCANNHIGDRGERGAADTAAALRAAGVAVAGLHEARQAAFAPAVLEHAGVRLALFDATYGVNQPLDPHGAWQADVLDDGGEALARAVAASDADVRLCFVHAGGEYEDAPSQQQRALAERLVDAGADAVVFSHPHVVLPAETLRTAAGHEGLVCWSLGNFASGQQDAPETQLGAAVELDIAADGPAGARIASWRLVPLVCADGGDGLRVWFLDDYPGDAGPYQRLFARRTGPA